MSFLQRLRGRGVHVGRDSQVSNSEQVSLEEAQLDVDLFQSDTHIVIYAQLAGAEISNVQVSIEGEANEVLITGKRVRPEEVAFLGKKVEGDFLTKECIWGDFSRSVTLPGSVDIERSDAKTKNGVLVLTLPFLMLGR